MSKIIKFNTEAREKVKSGVDQLANAVKVTLGPKGRNVIIDKKFGTPQVTKDGVTVAKEIELKDPIENMGAQMVKEVASKTADLAGDGTTTATVLTQAIVSEGLKMVTAGANPMDLKRGMDKAVNVVVRKIKELSQVVGDDFSKIQQIATISANNDEEIGTLIADAFKVIGKDGTITLEESKGFETSMRTVEGMQFDKGFLNPNFATNMEKGICEYEDCYILLHEKGLDDQKNFVKLFEACIKANKALLVISENLSDMLLGILVVSKLRSGLKVVAVKCPAHGDNRKGIMEDIAILTGGTVISPESGYTLENIDTSFLGQAQRITVTKDNTIIQSNSFNKDAMSTRIQLLRGQIESCTSEFDKEKLQERLAKLTGGISVISIGASTEVEMKEKKDRVDDSLRATKAAIEEGITEGGGVTLIRCIESLNSLTLDGDQQLGVDIIKKCLEVPLRQILENCGADTSYIVRKVKEGTDGYNAKTDEFVNMIEAGIIDPSKVVRVALQNANSIAGMIITSECVISIDKEEETNQEQSY